MIGRSGINASRIETAKFIAAPLRMHAPPPPPVISLVENEAVLREEMAFQLRQFGFRVEAFDSAEKFYRYLASRPRTIAVLDIGLDGEDGLSICRYLREHDRQMGIVFVTGRSLRQDRLAGLEVGADAYLVKPVDMDELVLVLKRLALRFADGPPAAPAPPVPAAAGPSWRIEPGSAFLVSPNGMRLRLSLNEMQLMQLLAAPAGTVRSHAELAQALGLLPDEADKHRIEVIVSRLRDKARRECGQALPILSVRGIGYRLDATAP